MTLASRIACTVGLTALLAGCGEKARPAEARNAAGTTADTTGTSGAIQQQSVQNSVPAGPAPGPGPGH
ncbi:hypothetical protein [Hymenobacter sp. UYP22]|uniref:hypothetical protein n=1 Tax=Hymenobacter sp. UYP22 TaxID=3156348 RepID=UPI0033931D2B